MAAEIYDQIFAYINGGLVAESTQITTELRSDVQPIATMAKDFAGVTPSPVTRSVTIENMLPTSGDEYDYEGFLARREFFTLKLLQAGSGKAYEGAAYLTSVKKDSGVGKTTTTGLEIMCEGKPFE
jgi:hypothetical protein